MNGHGGRREGAGRKLGSCIAPELKKDQRVVIMCTKKQVAKLKELAQTDGLTVSAYILQKLKI